MDMRRCGPLVVVLLVVLSFATSSAAQTERASLSGRLTDPNGGVVPNAQVELTNIDTNIRTTTTTNGEGLYAFPNVRPGRYRLTVAKEGFKQIAKTDIVLNVQDVIALNFALEIGSVNETVTVLGGTPLINTESAAVSTVVDRQFVENIPLNGRSFQTLIELTPGVVLTTGNSASGSFSVNGQRQDANAFTVDGVSANFGGAATGGNLFLISGAWASGSLPGLTNLGTTQSLASVDAMQEFRVQTSTYSAEYGRQPGGQISIVTRSGTNQFHGSLFEYLRNTIFDANNWFSNFNHQPRPPEQQNDFGGTFGGPVTIPELYNGKDRTFFFFSYEGLRLRLPQFTLSDVPTLALRQSAPASLQPLLNSFAVPNGEDLGNGFAEFSASYSNPSTLNATSIRIDHTIHDKWSIFGRYNLTPSYGASKNLSNLSNVLSSHASIWTATLGLTGAFSPHVTNDLRANYSKHYTSGTLLADSFGGARPAGIEALLPSQYVVSSSQASLTLNFPGVTGNAGFVNWNVYAGKKAQIATQAVFNLVDSISYRLGSHQFKFGADFRRLTPTQTVNQTTISVVFRSQQQVLSGIAPSVFAQANAAVEPIFTNYSVFAQDSWKVTRRFTADLGLRWDVNPAPGSANGTLPLAVNQVNSLASIDLVPEGTPQWKTTYNNFGPRLGLAYQLMQNPGHEAVIRGGFGVFYDTGNNLATAPLITYPFNLLRSLTNVAFPINAAQVAPPTLPDLRNLTPPYGTPITLFDPNLKLPYTLHLNVAIEQALGSNQAVTVSYVGNSGQRLLINQQYTINAINPKFTTVNITTNRADSSYNGLQAQFQRRLSHGWQGLASYTWSHAIDTASTDSASAFPPIRGNSNFDVRHLFAAAFVYQTPKQANRLADTLLGGWSLEGGMHGQSALPVNVISSQVLNTDTGGFNIIFPNIVPGVPFYLSGDACTASNAGVACPGGRRINPAAFRAPPTGQNGNLGRNVLRGLPSWQVDFAVDRRFSLTEKLSLVARAEAFNLFNHPNFGLPNTTLTAANFGEPTNTQNVAMSGLSSLYQIGGPRSMQFALKLVF